LAGGQLSSEFLHLSKLKDISSILRVTLSGSSSLLLQKGLAMMVSSLALSLEDARMILDTPDLRGHLVESAVGAFLLAESDKWGFEVLWWREGNNEVDFVLRRGTSITAIEVKSGRNRRAGGLREFKKRCPEALTMVVGDQNCTVEDFLTGSIGLFDPR
jgi:hypothetical protein